MRSACAGQRGIITLRGKYDALNMGESPASDKLAKAIPVVRDLAFFYMHEGEFDQAASWLDRGLEMSRGLWYGEKLQREFHVLLGINALRRGEIENCLECVGPSSCIFPIERDAVHTPAGGLARGRQAVHRVPAEGARRSPGPLAAQPGLHDAGRISRQGPARIPDPARQVPFEDGCRPLRERRTAGGPGGARAQPGGRGVFDDFNGDDLPDLFTTSIDVDRGASLFVNRGDGTFEERSAAAGLDAQVYALNLTRADYDNDGNLDVLLMRGAWEEPARLSLLRNKGVAFSRT